MCWLTLGIIVCADSVTSDLTQHVFVTAKLSVPWRMRLVYTLLRNRDLIYFRPSWGCGRRCGVLRHEREQSLLVALGQFFFLRNHADFCRTIALQRNWAEEVSTNLKQAFLKFPFFCILCHAAAGPRLAPSTAYYNEQGGMRSVEADRSVVMRSPSESVRGRCPSLIQLSLTHTHTSMRTLSRPRTPVMNDS